MQNESESEFAERSPEENILREAAIDRLDNFWKRILRRALMSSSPDKLFVLDCLIVAVGWGELVGLESAADISLKHFGNDSRKQLATKWINEFEEIGGLDKMPGQRSADGRKKMREARLKQLKQKIETQ